MLLKEIENPKQLYDFMDAYLKYEGVNKGYLKTPEELIETGKGHCWETTELERVILNQLGFKCYCFFLVTPGDKVTHTTLVYEDANKFYWFEWAWGKYSGIHKFNTLQDAIDQIRIAFLIEYKNYSIFTQSETGKVIASNEIETFKKLSKWKNVDHSFLDFSRIPSSKTNVDFYKKQYPNLSHVKSGHGFIGSLLINRNNNEFVAVLQCRESDSYIVALEVSDKYQKQGIATKLLKLAVDEFSAKNLSVNKTNLGAIRLYKNQGWVIIKEDLNMYYMSYQDYKKPSKTAIFSKW